MTHFEHDVVISGVGHAAPGRRLGRSGLDLTLEAVREALLDAGLVPSDIDGLVTYPGLSLDQGFAGASATEIVDALRLKVNWFSGISEIAIVGSLVEAAMAISCGLASHVLTFRTITESTAQGSKSRASILVPQTRSSGDGRDVMYPYGAPSGANWAALRATRHFYEFGTTREQLAQIPLTCRANASRNPEAIFSEAMTLDDYLGVRMISTPLCLYDCDVPVDASTAIILSHRSAVPGNSEPIGINAVGVGMKETFRWDIAPDQADMSSRDAASMLWNRTDLTTNDVDFAQLYDGFSIFTLLWLEDLGFCKRGEGGSYIEDGTRISMEGELPINTDGGQLSGGRRHGFGFVREAVLQLRGEADRRQVQKAEVGMVGVGGGPWSAALLLTKQS